jgi:hypothetical protein
MNLEARSGYQVGGFPEKPPALPHLKQEEPVKGALGNPETLLQVLEQLGPLPFPCQCGP